MGIWPPSNQAGIFPPVRALWPLCPRPAVPPSPVAAPLPRRLRARVAPEAGRMVPMRIITSPSALHHLDEVADLEDHAPDLGRVGLLDDLVQAVDPEGPDGGHLVPPVPARALDLADPDRLLSHSARSAWRRARPC